MARRTYHSKSEKSKPRSSFASKKTPWERVLKYISYRPRSEKEVRVYLGEDCTEEMIDRLKDLKFLDDVEFARMFIEQRTRFRPKSNKLLGLELKKKGIILPESVPATPDTELALKALEKKMRLWSKLPYEEYKVKAVRFLASRGFSWDTIAPVVKKAYNEPNVSY